MKILPSSIFDNEPSSDAAWRLWDGVCDMPEEFQGVVMGRFEGKAKKEGKGAIDYLSGVISNASGAAQRLSASDAEICHFAKERANEVRSLLMACPMTSTLDAYRTLAGYCKEHGAVVPDKVLLQGLIARMVDAGWWRRQLRRSVCRKVEAVAIDVGMVHKFAGLYASNETVARYRQQQERNRKALENTEAVRQVETINRETGEVRTKEEVFSLAELAALGVSNPTVRFAELMVRVRGMEAHAIKAGHVGLFCTGTTPPEMHARHAYDGSQNDLFDGVTVPRLAQQWLGRQWQRVRAELARLEVKFYGVRVAEPHHDGTPHWHMLVFMAGEYVETFKSTLKKWLIRGDWKPSKKKDIVSQLRGQGFTCKQASTEADSALERELAEQERAELADTARQQRACDFKAIDWKQGSAAGYLVKYLAKNISGQKVGADDEAANPECGPAKPASATAERVTAWASVWGVRQFQIVGGPPVGVWRELRRIKEEPEQLELFPAWESTGSKEEERKPDWGNFIDSMGGIDCKRKDRPVQLWKLEEPGRLTKYRDAAPSRVGGVVCSGVSTRTRDSIWVMRCQKKESYGVFDVVTDGRLGSVLGGVRNVVGSAFELGAKRPWTRVNNCTNLTPVSFGETLKHAYSLENGAEEARKIFAALVAAKKAHTGGVFRRVSLE